MAIKAGMSIAEAILQLTRGFQKVMGRKPDGLEKIKIQQEAVERLKNLEKVVDMEGNVIDTSKGIIGGRQIQDSPEFGQKVRETYDAAKGPGKGQEMVDALKSPGAKKSYKIMEDQLGVKLYGDETFDEILEIQRTGKHPRGEPKAQGGRAGFDMGGAPSIVLNPEERAMDKEFETSDVKEAIKEIIKRSIGPLDMAEIPISEKGRLRFGFDSSGSRQLTGGLDLLGGELNIGMGSGKQGKGMGFEFRKKFGPGAKGKRINRKEGGGMSRRQFIKIMGGLASIPILGKFFKGAKPAAKVAEVATKSMPAQPPEYFFDLAAKIKVLGKESKLGPRERVREIDYKNYSLQEDLTTGDMTIVKRKGDPEFNYEEEVMVLRKGQADEMTKGKTPPDEYEELTVRPDPEGKMKDVEDGIEPESIQEIVEEVGQGGGNLDQKTLEEIARGRLASGGVAMMLGE